MRSILSSSSLLLLVCGAGAEEPGSELQPIAPLARAIFDTNNAGRGFGNGMAMALSADGKTLVAVSNNGGLNVWDLGTRRSEPRSLDVPNFNLQNSVLALSPDGKMLAAGTSGGVGGDLAVRFFDLATGKEVRQIDNDQPLFSLAFSPDGRLLAVGTQQRVELWDAVTGEEVRLFPEGPTQMLAFSPDGKMLAASDAGGKGSNGIHVWETASGKERLHFQVSFASSVPDGRLAPNIIIANNNANTLTALAFSADSRLLAAAGSDAAIRLWDVMTGDELPPLTGFRGNLGVVLAPPDGKELIAVDQEGTRLSWSLAQIRRGARVRLMPLSDAEFMEMWNDLAESDVFRTYRARRYLTADPARAVPLLQRHLRPVPPGDLTRINQLIADLSNPNAGPRRKAMTQLRTKHGEAALGALLQLSPEAMANQAVQVLLFKLQVQYDTPERIRTLKAVRVLEDIGTPECRQLLEKLSKGAAGASLTTEAKAALDRLTARAKGRRHDASAEELWTALGNEDAGRAFQAVRDLSLRPQQAVPLFRKRLKPVPVVEKKYVSQLLAKLEADDFKTREQATEELEKVGEQAVPVLKKALAGRPSLESRKRMERLIEQWTSETPLPLLRGLRAIEVLEHIATADARQVLQTLAGGAAQDRLTREAKASLGRLAHR